MLLNLKHILIKLYHPPMFFYVHVLKIKMLKEVNWKYVYVFLASYNLMQVNHYIIFDNQTFSKYTVQ